MATLRKNGLASSCEPCRKSKVRCDHHVPICGRCSRTNKPDRCVYQPSPATTPRVAKSKPLRSTTLSRISGRDLNPLDSSRENWPAPERRGLSQSEYLGMTSHFALFKESTDQLDISNTQNIQSHDDTSQDSRSGATVDIGDIRQGAHLLQLLRNLSLYRRIVDSWLNSTQDCDALGGPVVRHVFQSLQEFSGVHSFDDDALFNRSREIFHLFSKPVPVHSSLTYSDFMSSMSCRWEIVGLAFAFVGSGTALPCDWDTMFQLEGKPVIPRKEMGRLALSAAETCLKFCNESGVLNDVVSWLTCQHTYLTTLIHGDRGKCKPWQ
jgi:chromatin structure-remodeling complex subunit RSC3/30